MVSEYVYRAIMSQLQYNYDTKEWGLPSRCFKDFEPDQILYFSSKYEAHKFVYEKLENE